MGGAAALKAGAGIVIKNNVISVAEDILNLTEIKQFITIEPYSDNKFIDSNGLQYTLNNGIATIFKNPFDITGQELPVLTYTNLTGKIQIFPYVKYGEMLYDVKFPNDCSGMFMNINAYAFEVMGTIDMSNVENMNFMFASLTYITELDLSNFINTAKLTYMIGTFQSGLTFDETNLPTHYPLLKKINIVNFNAPMLKNVMYLLAGNPNLGVFITDKVFNFSNVTDMSGAFSGLYINNINYNLFDVSTVENFSFLFGNSFNNIYNTASEEGISNKPSLNIESWNTSKATDMSNMFYHCNIDTLYLGSNFIINNNTDVDVMFGAPSLEKVYIPKKYDKLLGILNTQSEGKQWNYDEVNKCYIRESDVGVP